MASSRSARRCCTSPIIAILAAALVYLLLRRLREPQVRYISLFTDYFALFLLLGIALSGIWMRYFARVDVVAVKQLAPSA